MNSKTKQSVYVLFHGGGCFDGFGAAYSAWKAFKDKPNFSVKYVPVNYYQPIPVPEEELKTTIIYVVDFSYPREELLRVKALAQDILVLDHHKTAQKDLEGLDFAQFNMDKSGAMLSWEHFHPTTPAPRLIQYIQDRDLWTWGLESSKEVNAVLQSLNLDNVEEGFKNLQEYEERLENQLKETIAEGTAVLRSVNKSVLLSIQRSLCWMDIAGFNVPVVNTNLLESEIGNKLLDLYPEADFSATYFDDGKGEEKWSLRGKGKVDLGAIAKTFNGGGHRDAAGFKKKKK